MQHLMRYRSSALLIALIKLICFTNSLFQALGSIKPRKLIFSWNLSGALPSVVVWCGKELGC